MEELVHFHMRAFQLKMWFAGCDMFAVYGKLRELARAGVDNVKWCNLTEFKVAFEPQLVQREDPQCEAVDDESEHRLLFEDDE